MLLLAIVTGTNFSTMIIGGVFPEIILSDKIFKSFTNTKGLKKLVIIL